ncbi:MAG TPA: flagellar export protein FliJ [Methyloceanibacter sp.]|nr:flagellar export protein FliJ [Methyloceanibacter sp.]
MKSRDALIRLKRFDVEEKRRKVAEIELMIAEFNQMAIDLDRQIAIEQERAGITDVNHYAYPTFAKAALQRRNNLSASAVDLENQLEAARQTLGDALEDLKKMELLEERDAERVRLEQARTSQPSLTAGATHRAAS